VIQRGQHQGRLLAAAPQVAVESLHGQRTATIGTVCGPPPQRRVISQSPPRAVSAEISRQQRVQRRHRRQRGLGLVADRRCRRSRPHGQVRRLYRPGPPTKGLPDRCRPRQSPPARLCSHFLRAPLRRLDKASRLRLATVHKACPRLRRRGLHGMLGPHPVLQPELDWRNAEGRCALTFAKRA